MRNTLYRRRRRSSGCGWSTVSMPQPTNPVQEVLYRNRRKRFRINSGCLYESSAARHHHLVENKEGPLGTQQILKNKLATTGNPREELDNRSVVGEREERIRTNSSTVTFLRLAQSDSQAQRDSVQNTQGWHEARTFGWRVKDSRRPRLTDPFRETRLLTRSVIEGR